MDVISNAVININGSDVVVSTATANIYEYFAKKTDTQFVPDFVDDLFIKLFQINYLRDAGDYYCDEKITRSNWTHHTANTFLRTCQMLNFSCEFEIENRHDAAVRDRDGNVYICAEWEYDTNSIFNGKGEIKKLYETCVKHSSCVPLLFTYKIGEDYIDFVEKIFKEWNSILDDENECKLYLLTALFQKNEIDKVRELTGIRTVIIGRGTIDLWDDNTY
ncbi:MAG: hypothetical protein ACHQD8_00205 [Chitinophagales bacterium]